MARPKAPATGRILDAHQHFWAYNAYEYGWMSEGMVDLKRDYLPAELEPLLLAVGVRGTIAVQARRPLTGTRWLLELSDRRPFILWVVGWAHFMAGDIGQVLTDLAGHPRLVGIPELIHDMPDSDYALSKEHLAGIRELHSLNLTYDLLSRPVNLDAATALVDLFPEHGFVVSDIDKPRFGWDKPSLDTNRVVGRKTEAEDHTFWVRGIHEVARRDNVH